MNRLNQFFSWATGYITKVIAECNEAVQQQVTYLGFLMIAIPSLLGLMLGFSAGWVLSSPLMGLALGLLMAFVAHLSDRVANEISLSGNARHARLLRPLLVVTSVALMCVFFEVMILEPEIKQEMTSRFDAKIDGEVASLKDFIDTETEAVVAVDKEMSDKEAKRAEYLVKAAEELDGIDVPRGAGPGKFYLAKLETFRQATETYRSDSTRLADVRAWHLANIAGAKAEIDSLLAIPFIYDDVPLAKRLNVIHDMVTGGEGWPVLLLLIAVACFSIVVEFLPIWYRACFVDVEEIKRVLTLQANRNAGLQANVAKVAEHTDDSMTYNSIEEISINHRYALIAYEVTCRVDHKEEEVAQTLREYNVITDGLRQLHVLHQENMVTLPEQYRDTAEFAYAVAMERLHNLIDEDFEEAAPTSV